MGDTYPYVTESLAFFPCEKTVVINFRKLVSFFSRNDGGNDFIMQTRISFSVKLAHHGAKLTGSYIIRRFLSYVKVIKTVHGNSRNQQITTLYFLHIKLHFFAIQIEISKN